VYVGDLENFVFGTHHPQAPPHKPTPTSATPLPMHLSWSLRRTPHGSSLVLQQQFISSARGQYADDNTQRLEDYLAHSPGPPLLLDLGEGYKVTHLRTLPSPPGLVFISKKKKEPIRFKPVLASSWDKRSTSSLHTPCLA
jgi:hypothetical protein